MEQLLSEVLRTATPTVEKLDRVAEAIFGLVRSGEARFLGHVKNRLDQIASSTGEAFDVGSFDLKTAQRLVANEVGCSNWDELKSAAEDHASRREPLLFKYSIAAMERGDFTALESMIGPEPFDEQIVDWYETGKFDNERETLAEIFSAACMLGYPHAVAYLLDKGVDPYAGMKTGLSGFHYAASSGRPDVIHLLIERKVPMEVRNMYGGTVFEQAIWSAVNEHTSHHAEIVEALIDAGAEIEPGTIDWWNEQNVPSKETNERVADALVRREQTK